MRRIMLMLDWRLTAVEVENIVLADFGPTKHLIVADIGQTKNKHWLTLEQSVTFGPTKKNIRLANFGPEKSRFGPWRLKELCDNIIHKPYLVKHFCGVGIVDPLTMDLLSFGSYIVRTSLKIDLCWWCLR